MFFFFLQISYDRAVNSCRNDKFDRKSITEFLSSRVSDATKPPERLDLFREKIAKNITFYGYESLPETKGVPLGTFILFFLLRITG